MKHAAAESQTEFSNDQVTVSVARKPDCIVEFKTKTSPGLATGSYKKAIKAISKEVALPGFRKGKAPDARVEKEFPSDIDRKWRELAAQDAFAEVLDLTKVPLLKDGKIRYNIDHCSLQDGVTLTLTIETEPTIPSVDPKKFHPKKQERTVIDDEKIDQTIRQVQLFFAEWAPVKDRGVQANDFILINLDTIEEEPPTRVFSGVRFEVKPESMAEWMLSLVSGMKAGETREGVSIPDDKYATEEEKATLKPKKVRLHVLMIESATVPPIDDAFAQRIGAPNVKEMRTSISRLLNKQADNNVRSALRAQADEFLLADCDFDLPHSLVQKEGELRLKMLMQDPEFMEHWNRIDIEEKKKTLSTLFEQAKKAVKMFYLCRKILADANISISAKDIPPPVSDPLEALLVHQPTLNQNQDPQMHQAEVVSRLLLEKAEDYLIDNAS